MRNGLWMGLAVVVGCHGSGDGAEYEAATLERTTVLVDQELPEDVRVDWHGDVEVDGSDANWDLTVKTDVTNIDVQIHSAAHSDLSGLTLTDAIVSVQPEAFSNELSIEVVDSDGKLVYLAEPVKPGPLTQEAGGLGLIAPADDLYQETLDGWDLTLTAAVFRTDTGDVDLLPGQPQEVTVDGDSYRVVLTEAFTAELEPSAGSVQCTGASDRLAFELVRVDPGSAAVDPLVRDAELDIPTATCTAIVSQ